MIDNSSVGLFIYLISELLFSLQHWIVFFFILLFCFFSILSVYAINISS